MFTRARAAGRAFVQWLGETCVGLIPLLAYEVMHTYATTPSPPMVCPPQQGPYLLNCHPLADNVSQEVCILTVVISGLAVLSLANLGPRRRQAPNTVWTYLLIVITIMALISGALLYAVFGVRIDKGADTVTLLVLAIALASSLFLALEGAILDA